MKNRNEFPKLLMSKGLTGSAAEIGVAEGYFSHHILDHWTGILWQIDPWKILKEPGFSGHGEATDKEQEARYQRMVQKVQKYNGRCRLFRGTSANAVLAFPDNHFDFVYIDANHKLESVQEDIRLWWPKVRSGGILAGHDYLDGIIDTGDYGVKTAVAEFAKKYGLKVNVTEEKDYPSWWVEKP